MSQENPRNLPQNPSVSPQNKKNLPQFFQVSPQSGPASPAVAEETLPATFTPDGVSVYFDELLALSGSVSAPHFYPLLGQTLRRAAESATCFNGLTLGGLHAKVDFLCKEHGIPQALRQDMNAVRRRIRDFESAKSGGHATLQGGTPPPDTALQRLSDIKAVSRFITAVFGERIPEALARTFVANAPRPAASVQRLGEVLRCVAERWDEQAIHVRADALGEKGADVVLKGKFADWSYLLRILSPGAQLNLVRPVLQDGRIDAEVIVYEPDFLVDVTAIVHCFTEYSNTPFNHLLHRLEPFAGNKDILLGNFAGMLLDNAVYGRHLPFDEVFSAFVGDNLLDILALEDAGGFSLSDFREQGMAQARHIDTALHETLAQDVGGYRPEQVVLEPSFVCEMLGLQGRMDFLQLDHRVLIEQKGGKGGFVPYHNDPDRPVQKEQHYVQLLLYRAILRYNFSKRYAENGKNLRTFLLYSRYARPLLGLGPAPELFYEAMRVRNGMVWYEQLYCREGARLLERIMPESLRQKPVNERFWQQYVRPRLAGTLSTVQQASVLERNYFSRFLRFIATEHRLAKVGDNTQQSNSYASKWFSTPAEKHDNGEIYDDLRLLPPEAGTTVSHVRFAFAGHGGAEAVDADTTNFRRGDIVLCYPYDEGGVPDCRRTHVFRGILSEISPGGLRIRLAAPQGDARVFLHDARRPWAIEHDLFESAYSNLYAGLTAFMRAPQERRDLLLLQRPPRTDASREVRGDYGRFNAMMRRVKQACDIFLIIGPPGTGKTSYGMLNTLREELREPGSRVLLLSYTNRAVDEACSKLLEAGIPFLRIGSADNCDPACHHCLFDEQLRGLTLPAARERLLAARVVAGTVSALARRYSLFALLRFTLAIVDEASQILEPHLLPLFAMMHGATPAIGRFVMIGDHKQLPAVVRQPPEASAVSEGNLREIGLTDCRSSLFERLLRRYGNDPAVTFMLTRQGRMHRDIASFPNRYFYGGLLDVVPLPHQVVATDSGDCRISFCHVPPPDVPLSSAVLPSPKVNMAEARVIARLSAEVYQRHVATFSPEHTLGIIVPYRNQIAAVRSCIADECRHRGIAAELLAAVSIDTVERYQGSQRDYIIYGFTVSHNYQLAFLTGNVFTDVSGNVIDRKLNVAMTRARSHLVLVGNAPLLQRNLTFARLIAEVKAQGGYREMSGERPE